MDYKIMLTQAILSIGIIYAIVSLINRWRVKKFCPICTAVSVTWLWLLLTYFLGWHVDTLLIALLMGGSVVGIMYQLKRTPWAHLYAVMGFSAVYFLLQEHWFWFGIALGLAILLGVWQRPESLSKVYRGKKLSPELEKEVKEIEKKLEECCP